MNAFASAASEIVGPFLGGLWYRILGLNFALVLSFMLSTLGAVCILEYGI